MSALREEAEREALERRVDRTVRIVALGGDPGWAHVNYSREVALDEETTLRVEATFGARVNGATVRHSAHGIVYEALDYGRCLVVYRAVAGSRRWSGWPVSWERGAIPRMPFGRRKPPPRKTSASVL